MAQVSTLVKSITALPDPAKKRISAVLGAAVADAASLPLEWIYKDDTMKEIVGDKNPEFWPECKCPFFTIPSGSQSCYGDELVTSLKALATAGQVNLDTTAQAITKHFGDPDSPYQIALAKRQEKKFPVAGPWINGGVIQFLKNQGEGVNPPGSPDCEDHDGLTVSLPVYLKDATQVESAAKLLTTNAMVLEHLQMEMAILSNYMSGMEEPIKAAQTSLATQLPTVVDEIEQVRKQLTDGKSLGEVISEFGKACSLPGSFQGAIATLLTHNQYVSAVRANILGGGDCCSRGNFLGACLAARDGVQAIPMEWLEKVHGIEDILQAALKVYSS